jgi:hypothetical protein
MPKIILSTAALVLLGLSVACGAKVNQQGEVDGLVPPVATESESIPLAADPLSSTAAPSDPEASSSLAPNAGQFVTVEQDHPTTGTASIVTENGQRYIAFDAAFDTARGPDVTVVLYQGREIPVNLGEGDYVTLASLQSFSGAQRYLIPADLELADYQSVGIWCRQFDVTFGYAPL